MTELTLRILPEPDGLFWIAEASSYMTTPKQTVMLEWISYAEHKRAVQLYKADPPSFAPLSTGDNPRRPPQEDLPPAAASSSAPDLCNIPSDDGNCWVIGPDMKFRIVLPRVRTLSNEH